MKVYLREKGILLTTHPTSEMIFESKTEIPWGITRYKDKTYELCYTNHEENWCYVKELHLNKKVSEIKYESHITCPYCGHMNYDSWEAGDSEDEYECGSCLGIFSYQREVAVTYSSQPVKPPQVFEIPQEVEKV